MNQSLLLLIISTIIFGGGFLIALWNIKSGTWSHSWKNMILIGLGFFFQTYFLIIQGDLHGKCPITSLSEILIFIAWSAVILYFLTGRSFRLSLLGVFTAPFVFLIQLLALLFGDLAFEKIESKSQVDYWVELHASVSLFSYGAFAMAAIAGVMYLVQERFLAQRNLKGLFYHMPPIRYLHSAVMRLILIGFLILTLGLISAFFMREWPGVAKLSLISIVWITYGIAYIASKFSKISPRQTAFLSVALFSIPLLTLLVIRH